MNETLVKTKDYEEFIQEDEKEIVLSLKVSRKGRYYFPVGDGTERVRHFYEEELTIDAITANDEPLTEEQERSLVDFFMEEENKYLLMPD